VIGGRRGTDTTMTQLVVRQHRPIRFAIAVVLASMLTATGTWLLLDAGHWSVIEGRLEASAELQRLLNANRNLEQLNSSLRERVFALERTESLDKQTESFLQGEIRELQEEVFRLKGELAFFEGIMEAAGRVKGLDVHDIYVRRMPQANTYRLQLVLTNVSDKGEDAEGQAVILLEGRQNGVARMLALNEVAVDTALDLSFAFRNFKRFDVKLQLPAGFAAQRVHVELQPNDKKRSKITKTFDWPATAN
jgi:hypothetical protein